MLKEMLLSMTDGQNRSLEGIARHLKVSPDLALHMAGQLVRMGYLEDLSAPACPSAGSVRCGGWGGCSGKASSFPGGLHMWALTGKGKRYVFPA